MSSTTAEWLLEISGLTVRSAGTEDPTEHGQILAAQVRAAADAYVQASPCADGCVDACLLADMDGGRAACLLARRLSTSMPGVLADADAGSGHRVAARYVQSLRVAATSVFHCRHAHAAGECWFSPQGAPLCGEVLAVAHRLGA